MNTDTPDARRERHIANGPLVASVRNFLQRYEVGGDSELLDGLIAVTDGGTLTVNALRTLLAEHDAYRSEAYGRTDNASRTCAAKSWPVGTYTCDRAAGHDGDHGAGTAVRYQWPEHAVVEPSAGGNATRTADYVRDVLTNPDATETEMRGAALAAYVALRQMTEGEA